MKNKIQDFLWCVDLVLPLPTQIRPLDTINGNCVILKRPQALHFPRYDTVDAVTRVRVSRNTFWRNEL